MKKPTPSTQFLFTKLLIFSPSLLLIFMGTHSVVKSYFFGEHQTTSLAALASDTTIGNRYLTLTDSYVLPNSLRVESSCGKEGCSVQYLLALYSPQQTTPTNSIFIKLNETEFKQRSPELQAAELSHTFTGTLTKNDLAGNSKRLYQKKLPTLSEPYWVLSTFQSPDHLFSSGLLTIVIGGLGACLQYAYFRLWKKRRKSKRDF